MSGFFILYFMHTIYILFSEKIKRHYIGYTSDLEIRLEFHKIAQNHKFTYNADDWKVLFTITCETKQQALAIEKHLKAMKSKTYIENIQKYPEMITKLLQKYA